MSKVVKIYDSVLDHINAEMNLAMSEPTSEALKKEKESYLAGLKAAKQFVENEQSVDYDECAYEKFEEVLLSYLASEILELEDIKEIINDHIPKED